MTVRPCHFHVSSFARLQCCEKKLLFVLSVCCSLSFFHTHRVAEHPITITSRSAWLSRLPRRSTAQLLDVTWESLYVEEVSLCRSARAIHRMTCWTVQR
jgi:hypothetical protein